MKKILLFLCLAFLILCVQGCAICMASNLPIARAPTALRAGLRQVQIDRKYGAPLAAGMSEDEMEYIEQIQFIDGCPIGWKVTRICLHVILDAYTLFLWEFPGTIIEVAADKNYRQHTFFVVYDAENRVSRVVDRYSPEGEAIARLPWVVEPVNLKTPEYDGFNRIPTSLRLTPEQR